MPPVFDVRLSWLAAGILSLLASGCVLAMRTVRPAPHRALLLMSAALGLGGLGQLLTGARDWLPPIGGEWFALCCSGVGLAVLVESMRTLYRAPSRLPSLAAAVSFLAILLAMAPDALSTRLFSLGFELACCGVAVWTIRTADDAAAPRARTLLSGLFAVMGLAALTRLVLASTIDEAMRRGLPPSAAVGGLDWLAGFLFAMLPMLTAGVSGAIAWKRLVHRLAWDAGMDTLTGTASRRMLAGAADPLLAASSRGRARIAVLMVDLDHFAQINERHGQPVGDRVLRHVADVLRKVLREDSLLVRYGGEEFCALVPVDDPRHAWIVSERLRRAVEAAPWVEAGEPVPVTVSVGVVLHEPGVALEEVLAAADARLVRAKQTGRNRVVADEERDRQAELWPA